MQQRGVVVVVVVWSKASIQVSISQKIDSWVKLEGRTHHERQGRGMRMTLRQSTKSA